MHRINDQHERHMTQPGISGGYDSFPCICLPRLLRNMSPISRPPLRRCQVSDPNRPRPLSLDPTRRRGEFVGSPDQKIGNVPRGRLDRLPSPYIRRLIPIHYHLRLAYLKRLLERFLQAVYSQQNSSSELVESPLQYSISVTATFLHSSTLLLTLISSLFLLMTMVCRQR
jgi:hypothetical protein